MLLKDSPDGFVLWAKLVNSTNDATQAYVRSIENALQKYGCAWFSDYEEQQKKKLNNQDVYCIHYEIEDNAYHIALLHAVSKNGGL